MSEILARYIIAYGYMAIFCIVLIQELGMPGLPNALVLFYFGYISNRAGLNYAIVILLAVIAEITGSLVLFFLFYRGTPFLTRIKPAWLRLPSKKIALLMQKIALYNERNMFLAKLTPFVRSYLPIVAGLLQVNPVLFARIVLITAFIWTGVWITAGWWLHF